MAAYAHAAPDDDLVVHDTSTGEPACVCGPTIQLLAVNDGALPPIQLIVHHSLDGREFEEEA